MAKMVRVFDNDLYLNDEDLPYTKGDYRKDDHMKPVTPTGREDYEYLTSTGLSTHIDWTRLVPESEVRR